MAYRLYFILQPPYLRQPRSQPAPVDLSAACSYVVRPLGLHVGARRFPHEHLLSRKRRTTARPLVRAKLLLQSTAYIIQTSALSAAPRLDMLRNLYRLLAPPSAHTIYRHHRTRAGVINYWRQGANVLPATSAPPAHPQRKNEGKRSIAARMPYGGSPLVFAQKQTGLLEKCDKW
jgi:hypothetical protein